MPTGGRSRRESYARKGIGQEACDCRGCGGSWRDGSSGLASADIIEGPRPSEATATAVENGVKIKVTKGEVEDQG